MILSKDFLKKEARRRNISEFSEDRIINENAEIVNESVEYGSIFDIFLSHSSLDKRLVLTLVTMFNGAGYSVYVDWIQDHELDRSKVTSKTAYILKQRMNGSRGLSYIATDNILYSKWCPWELGYFDGKKNARCCILPIVDNGVFRGQEYLGLYPYLQYSEVRGTYKYDFWVYEAQSTDKYISLREWLDGKNFVHNR